MATVVKELISFEEVLPIILQHLLTVYDSLIYKSIISSYLKKIYMLKIIQ